MSEILNAAAANWCIAGGWAIDLWLGRQTRPHGDIEIAAPRSELDNIRAAFEPRYQLYAAGGGETAAVRTDEAFPPDRHQCWIADPITETWHLDLMLEPGDAETWVFRRDQRIRAPRDRMMGRSGGIPYLNPEGVLLFKTKLVRTKDQSDFEECLPRLPADARAWLAAALSLIHSEHEWLAVL